MSSIHPNGIEREPADSIIPSGPTFRKEPVGDVSSERERLVETQRLFPYTDPNALEDPDQFLPAEGSEVDREHRSWKRF